MIVVDASTLVSAALKVDSIPERALLRAVNQDNRLLLSQEVEDEYREVIFRPKFDRYVSIARRQRILDIVAVAAERIEPTETVRECSDPKDNKYLDCSCSCAFEARSALASRTSNRPILAEVAPYLLSTTRR